MEGKQVGAIITLIFLIPTLVGLMIWSHNLSKNPEDPNNLEQGANLIANNAVPWWIGILEWLAGLPGIIGASLVIAFIFFLRWIGEIR